MNSILKILREERAMNYKGGLYHETQIMLAYNSNKIEGSSLSEEQTRYMYETHSIIQDLQGNQKNLKISKILKIDDIIEMTNHFFLFNKMLDNCDKKLSPEIIKEYHYILKRGTSDERLDWFNTGDYKKLANTVGGSETSSPEDVEHDINNLIENYYKNTQIDLNKIIDFHVKFERIHPFQDGNGRVGRIIMFRECLANDIIPFIIQEENKIFYYRGLREYMRERGYLRETCLHEQDIYSAKIKYFTKNRGF